MRSTPRDMGTHVLMTESNPDSTAPIPTRGLILVVINPASGNPDPHGADPLCDLLHERLSEQGMALRVMSFEPQGFAVALHEALSAEVSAVYVAGGDGTVLAVVEALDGRDVPLGIIPRGTMNWVAKDLGIPPDPEQAIETLLSAKIGHIDLGRVNGHPFLCACMIGVGPLVARERERERHTTPWIRWPKLLLTAWRFVQRYRQRRIRLVTKEGHGERLRTATVIITNNLLDDTFGALPRRSRLDGGVLGIYAVRNRSTRELARLLTRLLMGNWQQDDALLAMSGSEALLAVSGRGAMSALLDGEIRRLKTPLRLSIEPHAVTVLVPAR